MEYRPLGRTGIEFRRLELGGVSMSSRGEPYEQAKRAVGRALEELGELERLLILSTKLGGWPDPCDPQNTDHLRHSVEESRGLLRRDTIDIFMIDEPDRPGQHDWWSDWDAFNGPVLAVLDEPKRDGAIRATG